MMKPTDKKEGTFSRLAGGEEPLDLASLTPPAEDKGFTATQSMEEPPSPSEDPNLPGIGDLPDCGEPKVANSPEAKDTFAMPQAIRRSPRLAETTTGACADTEDINGVEARGLLDSFSSDAMAEKAGAGDGGANDGDASFCTARGEASPMGDADIPGSLASQPLFQSLPGRASGFKEDSDGGTLDYPLPTALVQKMAHVTIDEARNHDFKNGDCDPLGGPWDMGKAAGNNAEGEGVGVGRAVHRDDGDVGGKDGERSAILDEIPQDAVAGDKSSGEPRSQKTSPARGFEEEGRERLVLPAGENEALELAATRVVEQEDIKAAEVRTAADADNGGVDHSAPARGASTTHEGAGEINLVTSALPSFAAANPTSQQHSRRMSHSGHIGNAARATAPSRSASGGGGNITTKSFLRPTVVAAAKRRESLSGGASAPEIAPESESTQNGSGGGALSFRDRGRFGFWGGRKAGEDGAAGHSGKANRRMSLGVPSNRHSQHQHQPQERQQKHQQQEGKPRAQSTGRKSLTIPQMPNFHTTKRAERHKPMETTEEAEIRKQREMQEQLRQITRRSQLGLERNRRIVYEANLHKSKQQQAGSTVPEPFRLSQSNRPGKMAVTPRSQSKEESHDSRKFFATVESQPPGDHDKSAPAPPKPTQPRSPRLRTDERAAVHHGAKVITAKEPVEADVKKAHFKARGYSADGFGVGGERGVFKPQKNDKRVTQQEPFRLSTGARAAQRPPSPHRNRDEEELSKPFKARPLPSPRRQSVGFGSANKAVAVLTEARPFTLRSEERGKAKQALLAQRLLTQQKQDEAATKVRARPLPTPCRVFAPQPSKRPPTEAEGFQLSSQARHERASREFQERVRHEEEEARRASQVTALPLPSTTFAREANPSRAMPATPANPSKPARVMLHSTARAEGRARWEVEKQGRIEAEERHRREVEEMAKTAEERRIADLRRRSLHEGGMAFKARPIRRASKPPESAHLSTAPLTTPVTPNLRTKRRAVNA